MIEKISHVRNPLTVIAMFAGIAEVSGTVVLPFLQSSTQIIYVWFLMLFPFVLVVAFFGTLLWRPHVLYAPSDYKDENLFAAMFRPSSSLQRIEKIKEEIADETSENIEQTANTEPSSTDIIIEPPTASTIHIETGNTKNSNSDSEQRIVHRLDPSFAAESALARNLAVSYLSRQFSMPFVQDVTPESQPYISFDAVGSSKDSQIIVEFRYTRTGVLPKENLLQVRHRFGAYWSSLSSQQKAITKFLYLVIIGNKGANTASRAKNTIEMIMHNTEYPLDYKVLNTDYLKSILTN